MALYLKKFGWNWSSGYGAEDFLKFRQYIFAILLLNPLGKGCGPSQVRSNLCPLQPGEINITWKWVILSLSLSLSLSLTHTHTKHSLRLKTTKLLKACTSFNFFWFFDSFQELRTKKSIKRLSPLGMQIFTVFMYLVCIYEMHFPWCKEETGSRPREPGQWRHLRNPPETWYATLSHS